MPVDLSAATYAAFEQELERAKQAAAGERWAVAAAAYQACAARLRDYAAYAAGEDLRRGWLDKARAYQAQAERLAARATPQETTARSRGTQAGDPAGDDVHRQAVEALIHKADIRWDQIAGLEDTKQAIKAAYGLALARPPAGVSLRPWRNLLLYGPPGTGKTMLAAATSAGLEASFFNVKVSDLLSKYFGESSRLVSALYEVARERAPAVVFLDEFESLSPPRDGSSGGPEGRIVATLLAELDGLAQKGDPRLVLTIAATNQPWRIDGAVLSRFERRVYVPLPDLAARRRILELETTGRGLQSELGVEDLAERSHGYSGRELAQAARAAVQAMVARVNQGLLAAVDAGKDAVAGYQLQSEPISRAEWEAALAAVSPAASAEDLARYKAWGEAGVGAGS